MDAWHHYFMLCRVCLNSLFFFVYLKRNNRIRKFTSAQLQSQKEWNFCFSRLAVRWITQTLWTCAYASRWACRFPFIFIFFTLMLPLNTEFLSWWISSRKLLKMFRHTPMAAAPLSRPFSVPPLAPRERRHQYRNSGKIQRAFAAVDGLKSVVQPTILTAIKFVFHINLIFFSPVLYFTSSFP